MQRLLSVIWSMYSSSVPAGTPRASRVIFKCKSEKMREDTDNGLGLGACAQSQNELMNPAAGKPGLELGDAQFVGVMPLMGDSTPPSTW